jgi:hypothetical protein
MYVLRRLGSRDYVKEYDPDGNNGQGEVTFTHNILRAKWYAAPEEALAEWQQQSKVKPLREDGKPNRPLSAFTMTVEPV